MNVINELNSMKIREISKRMPWELKQELEIIADLVDEYIKDLDIRLHDEIFQEGLWCKKCQMYNATNEKYEIGDAGVYEKLYECTAKTTINCPAVIEIIGLKK